MGKAAIIATLIVALIVGAATLAPEGAANVLTLAAVSSVFLIVFILYGPAAWDALRAPPSEQRSGDLLIVVIAVVAAGICIPVFGSVGYNLAQEPEWWRESIPRNSMWGLAAAAGVLAIVVATRTRRLARWLAVGAAVALTLLLTALAARLG